MGGTARIIANGNGQLDISNLTAAGLAVGSIEGSGNFFLGGKNLEVGGLNTDTAVSGIIQDGGWAGGVVGSLTKVGNGTLTLSGPNTYTGGTFINAGTVNVLHSQGLGLGNVTFTGGLLKSDPLVINIPGNYVQGAAATWQAAIAGTGAGQFDQLNIGGTATLGGTLRTVPFAGFVAHVGDSVTLVQSAGGLGGTTFATFDNQITTSGAAVQPQLTYTANDVVLQWVQGSFLPFTMTHNQRSVAGNLDTVTRDPRETMLINYLDTLSAAQLADAYDRIAPEELTLIFQLGFAGAEVQGYNLYNRIRDIRAGGSGFSAGGLSLYDPAGALDHCR